MSLSDISVSHLFEAAPHRKKPQTSALQASLSIFFFVMVNVIFWRHKPNPNPNLGHIIENGEHLFTFFSSWYIMGFKLLFLCVGEKAFNI